MKWIIYSSPLDRWIEVFIFFFYFYYFLWIWYKWLYCLKRIEKKTPWSKENYKEVRYQKRFHVMFWKKTKRTSIPWEEELIHLFMALSHWDCIFWQLVLLMHISATRLLSFYTKCIIQAMVPKSCRCCKSIVIQIKKLDNCIFHTPPVEDLTIYYRVSVNSVWKKNVHLAALLNN